MTIVKELEELAAWLSPLDFEKLLADYIDSRTEDTVTWVLETSEMKAWMNGDLGLLWCRGHPGVGKTMITSVVIDKLRKSDTTVPVLFAYCNYKSQFTTRNYLEVFLKQLVLKNFITDESIELFKKVKSNSETVSEDQLLETFISELQLCSKAFIIIDAFDEILTIGQEDSYIYEQDEKHVEGWNALSVAAQFGNTKLVKLLLQRGNSNLENKDQSGRTPLFWAAHNGHTEVINLL
ncbi:hypothetical protein M422DRAFT_151375, partial [Sphaerobolus stellatus SS14]